MPRQVSTGVWLALAGAVAALVYSQRQSIGSAVSAGANLVTAAISGWKSVQQGPQWVPVLNAAESQLGIPADLLARIAYEESHFRQDIIDGNTPSSAGALGLMQLLPKYFNTVQVPVPFAPSDTAAQIQQAGQLLVTLFNHFGDWSLAVAAYNAGQTRIDGYVAGTNTLPAETSSYVADILADVPVPSSGAA